MTTTVSGSSITFNDNTTQNTSAYGGGFAFRNRIINGDMRIDQRNAGASVNNASSSNTFPVDRFAIYGDSASKVSGQRSTTVPTGFVNSVLLTSLAATTAGANDFYGFRHNVEGFNVADLGWGSANAQTVTLSFWVRSSLTGTFSVAFGNNAANRAYVANYVISVANTWEQKTVTIAGDTSGTWTTDNTTGIGLWWDLGSGSNRAITGGSWSGTYGVKTSNSTNLVATNGATFYITGVQLEKGSTATSFDYRPYGQELALCQRYYYRVNGNGTTQTAMSFGGYSSSSTLGVGFNQFPVTMRIAPTAMEQSGTASHYAWRGTGSNVTFSGVPTWSDVTTENLAAYTGTVSSGLTSGQSIYTRALSNSAFLAWSAEL